MSKRGVWWMCTNGVPGGFFVAVVNVEIDVCVWLVGSRNAPDVL